MAEKGDVSRCIILGIVLPIFDRNADFERRSMAANLHLSGPKTRETSLLFKEVSIVLKTYLSFSQTWCRKRGSNPHGVATTGF